MKYKLITVGILSLIVAILSVIGVPFGVDKGPDVNAFEIDADVNNNELEPGSFMDSTAVGSPEVIAYYFHTTYRCPSCKKIEEYSKEAIETGFEDELNEGKLKFFSIKVDESANKHYVKDYRLYTKSLIICKIRDGKQVEWKNLIKVWQLTRNKEEFFKYVQQEINAYLKES